VAGLGRPAERHAVSVPACGGPVLPRRIFRPGPRRVRRADPGAGRRRGRPAADRDRLDTLNAKAAISAAREVAPQLPLWISVTIVDPERADAGRSDRRGVLDRDRVCRSDRGRRELLTGAEEMRPHVAELSRLANVYTACHRTPGCRTRSAATTRRRRRSAGCSASSPRSGLVNVVGGCCGTSPRTSRGSRPPCPACRRARSAAGRRGRAQRPGDLRDRPDTGFRDDRERTNVTGSSVPAAHRGGDPSGGRRRGAGAGAAGSELLDVKWTLTSRQQEAMTTFLT